MKLKQIAIATLLALGSSATLAAPSWIDWADASSGSLTVGSSTVGVTMTANTPIDLIQGDYYYNNQYTGGTAVSGTYAGLMPSDMIQVDPANSFTLTFTEAIVNPYIALVSVGQHAHGVTYTFNGTASVLSSGGNYWGSGSGSASGNTFTGFEYNGILQLAGTFTTLTISTNPGEHWHGFNVGTNAVTAPIPEPETYAMMLAGLGLMGMVARRRRAQRRA
jgi:hypothetical protein